MRADRLLSILFLLQSRGKISTRLLADELEVSPRTIHRDMEALSAAGIPVIAERGTNGGWRLMETYRSQLAGLKKDELLALFLSPSSKLLTDLGLNEDALKGKQKLWSAVPGMFQQEARHIWERIYIDTGTWRDSREQLPFLPLLMQAVSEEKRLNMVYRRLDGETVNRVVEPLGLVAKSNRWYLVAKREQAYRTYRASRIEALKVLQETFQRPERFNLERYWQESKQDFINRLPEVRVNVKATANVLSRLTFSEKFVRIVRTEAAEEDGWFDVELSFQSEEDAAACILGFGNEIRILHPESLKRKVVERAKEVLRLYKANG